MQWICVMISLLLDQTHGLHYQGSDFNRLSPMFKEENLQRRRNTPIFQANMLRIVRQKATYTVCIYEGIRAFLVVSAYL